MTNEEIKKSLQELFECESDFSVIQSGKKSSRVNGFYKPVIKELESLPAEIREPVLDLIHKLSRNASG